jgi:hypothetical protein
MPAKITDKDKSRIDLANFAFLLVPYFAATKKHYMKIILTGSLGNIGKPLAFIRVSFSYFS